MVNVKGFWLNQAGKEKLKLSLRKDKSFDISQKTKLSAISNIQSESEDGIVDIEFEAIDLYENCYELNNPALN